ncbi:hypothetical protein MKW98_009451 [Papaver atlanticum]|uniref:F-box domain-containing protein n=1 Tax=Papaver atlanticum TaxID=357466 RepID=A0AAD4SH42_9MAGN|nr:hypothetical protein MKW98_009451 [Papaver atlanticum]
MESLPSDIILDTVSRVPAESVLEYKLVCKRWGTLIRCSGSKYTNIHLSRLLNHLHDSDDDNDNLAAKVEPCLFFACRTDDPAVDRTLLFHGGQLSDGISSDEKYIYNQNLKRIYHPPMHNEPLSCHLVGSCNELFGEGETYNNIACMETWCMEFDIDYKAIVGTLKGRFQPILRPILLTKNGEIILLYGKSVLYCYERKTTILKMISNEASTDCFEAVEVIAHINTFASLEAIGENSKRYIVRPRWARTPWYDVIDEFDRVAPDEEIDMTRFRLS